MYWLFGHRVARVRQLKIWCILIILLGIHGRTGELETFCCCVFVVDVTKETAAW